MKIKPNVLSGITLMVVILIAASTKLTADTGTCGGATTTVPFTDVMSSPFFCQIAEAFFSGLTNGTTATTYSPNDLLPREQMAAFTTRTMDQSLKRGSRRASLDQYWTPTSADGVGFTPVGVNPRLLKSDGTDVWVASGLPNGNGAVSRVRCSDGKLLETWTGADFAFGVLVAKGRIFVTGNDNPGKLYQIDPTQTAGAVATLTTALGDFTRGIAFDGARVWTANEGMPFTNTGSVSIVTLNPVSVNNIATGFGALWGMVYDGANIWVTDNGDQTIKKLDASGNILQAVPVGNEPRFPAFDGTNIWVPNVLADTVTVVRASTGAVLATLSGNGMNGPFAAAFDGERVLITNNGGGGPTAPGPVSLWHAASLAPLGFVSLGTSNLPRGVCSDGLNFWIALQGTNQLARF